MRPALRFFDLPVPGPAIGAELWGPVNQTTLPGALAFLTGVDRDDDCLKLGHGWHAIRVAARMQ